MPAELTATPISLVSQKAQGTFTSSRVSSPAKSLKRSTNLTVGPYWTHRRFCNAFQCQSINKRGGRSSAGINCHSCIHFNCTSWGSAPMNLTLSLWVKSHLQRTEKETCTERFSKVLSTWSYGRSPVTCPRSHNKAGAELGTEARRFDSQSTH